MTSSHYRFRLMLDFDFRCVHYALHVAALIDTHTDKQIQAHMHTIHWAANGWHWQHPRLASPCHAPLDASPDGCIHFCSARFDLYGLQIDALPETHVNDFHFPIITLCVLALPMPSPSLLPCFPPGNMLHAPPDKSTRDLCAYSV